MASFCLDLVMNWRVFLDRPLPSEMRNEGRCPSLDSIPHSIPTNGEKFVVARNLNGKVNGEEKGRKYEVRWKEEEEESPPLTHSLLLFSLLLISPQQESTTRVKQRFSF